MTYDFERLVERRGTNCEKYDGCFRIFGTEELLPMWVADMDFETPSFIIEAMEDRLKHHVLGYSLRPDSYYNAVQGWLARRWQWQVDKQWIEFTPGTVCAVSLAIQAFTSEGDGVVIQTPVYGPFSWVIEGNGRRVERNRMKYLPDGRAEIDFDDLEVRLSRSKMFILCNPHNPTGRVYTQEELARIAELCKKYDVIVVADEIHCDLVQKPYRHIHFASLDEDASHRSVTIISPAKSFNVAGLSSSVVIVPDAAMRERFHQAEEAIHVGQGNIFGTIAIEQAFTHGDEWVDQLNDYIGGNIDFILKFLAEKIPSVKCYRPEAMYLIWLDFTEWGMTHKELCDFMLNAARIGMTEGRFFGVEGEGYMRMNVAAPRSVIEQAMNQLYEASLQLKNL